MGEASIVEMICGVLPQIAKEVSTPLGNIDSITMYGDQSSKLIENGTQNIDKVLNVVKDSLGIDVKDVVSSFHKGIGGIVQDFDMDNNQDME